MKKIFAFIMVTMLCAISAKAASVSINVDNPEAVTVTYAGFFGSATTVDIVAGDNTFTVDSWTTVKITANNDWLITHVSGSSEQDMPGNGKEFSTMVYSSDLSYAITTVKVEDFRNASFTLKYDDPKQVKAVHTGTFEEITIDDSANEMTVPFSSDYEPKVTLSNPLGKKLYKVTANGEPVAITGNSVSVELTPDMVVEVEAIYPDLPTPVHFVFTDPETTGFITAVSVDGVDVDSEQYLAEDFTVNVGSKVTLTCNADDYEINETTVNGTPFDFNYSYSDDKYSYSYVVTEETTFTFDVTAYKVITKKVIVEGAEYFTLYKGYSSNNNIIELHDGENLVDISTKDTRISIKLNDNDHYFETLTDNGEDCTGKLSQWVDYFKLSTEGDFVITVAKIVKDKKFILYVDDMDLTNSFRLYNGNNVKYGDKESGLESGYNEIEFYDGDGEEWYCTWAQTDGFNQMFINDEEHDGYYGSATQHYFEPQNNDVVRVYLGDTPDKVNVKFNVEDGLDLDVKRDIVTPVTDLTTPLKVFPNTRFTVAPTGHYMHVKVGDEPEFMSESPEFVVTKPATVTISKGDPVSIKSITAETPNNGNVYNLMGRKVAAKGNLTELPKGVYIVNGKKVIK